jgi:hypothetical protein
LVWRVTERLGGHLDIVTAPQAVVPLVIELAMETST